MATAHKPYYDSVRSALTVALRIRNFPCKVVERHNKPEVEIRDTPEVLMAPVEVKRNESEKCLIEGSVNSARISIKVKQADELEQILTRHFMRFLMQRAEAFHVLRRVPMDGYDISFLVTHVHVEQFVPEKLIDFIVAFMEDIDKEISEQKLSVSSRGRVVANDFLKQFT